MSQQLTQRQRVIKARQRCKSPPLDRGTQQRGCRCAGRGTWRARCNQVEGCLYLCSTELLVVSGSANSTFASWMASPARQILTPTLSIGTKLSRARALPKWNSPSSGECFQGRLPEKNARHRWILWSTNMRMHVMTTNYDQLQSKRRPSSTSSFSESSLTRALTAHYLHKFFLRGSCVNMPHSLFAWGDHRSALLLS